MKCDFETCEGFHRKFPSCLAEALYERADDADEKDGNTDYGFAALFLVYDGWVIPAGDWSGAGDMTLSPGTFAVLYEATSGAVGAVGAAVYPTDTEAQEAYDAWHYHFAIWEEVNGY